MVGKIQKMWFDSFKQPFHCGVTGNWGGISGRNFIKSHVMFCGIGATTTRALNTSVPTQPLETITCKQWVCKMYLCIASRSRTHRPASGNKNVRWWSKLKSAHSNSRFNSLVFLEKSFFMMLSPSALTESTNSSIFFKNMKAYSGHIQYV